MYDHPGKIPVLLIDLDGVIYQGGSAIAGAVDTINWINSRKIPHLYVTNTTSKSCSSLLDKINQLGIKVETKDIFTPIIAASQWLTNRRLKRVVFFVTANALTEFRGFDRLDCRTATSVDAIVIGDLGDEWSYSRLNQAFRLLMAEPRPVLIALGLTRFWQAEDGLRLDVAPFVKALEYASSSESEVLGKPSLAFYDSALDLLKAQAKNAIMIGDDIVGDIQGAQKAGMRAILVKTGKYRERDLKSEVRPDAILESIANLPDWWVENIA
ncbi:MAG: TIGR01458 family HAD-type hydrolase [Gammaproteobacteria bacterium]|nr:TIGR01458 family HAD-type hydrolase [Gammaproteobacteria bacterium]